MTTSPLAPVGTMHRQRRDVRRAPANENQESNIETPTPLYPCTLGPLYPCTFSYIRALTKPTCLARPTTRHFGPQYSPSNSHLESRRCYDRVVAVHAHRHDRIE